MFMSRIATGLLATLVCLAPVAAPAQSSAEAVLDAAIAGPQRSGVNKARDVYRHPKEVLLFFGFKPDMTVVEIWPDTGWFSEILAPALRQRGRYVAAQYPLEHRTTTPANRAARVAFDAMVAANPAAYDQVVSSDLAVPDRLAMVPPGSADLVLSFRSVHVWMARKYEDAMFKAAYDALKPGGVFGVTDHRAPEGWSREKQVGSGYVTESFVIAGAQKAGFRLAGTSELKANPRDTKDYPKGVWALPPALAYGDQDRAKYLAIGESDRMVIKFIKP
jgi:predicted methyltransferase